MKYLLLIIISFSSFPPLWAQENTIGLSEKQQKKLEKIKDADQQQKLLKKYCQQDSIKAAKEIKQLKDKVRQTVVDTLKVKGNLPGIPTTTIDTTTIDEVKSIAIKAANDSLNNYVDVELENIKLDSTTTDKIKQRAASNAKAAIENESNIELPQMTIDSTTTDKMSSTAKSEAVETLEGQVGREIPQITIDTTTIEKLEKEAEKRAEAALKGTKEGKALAMTDDSGFAELQNHKRKLEQTQEEIRRAAASKELKQKMTAQAKQYITENAEKIQQVQAQMGKLKQKYSYMPNSNDLSSAVKRSSLEGESLWKRMVIGSHNPEIEGQQWVQTLLIRCF